MKRLFITLLAAMLLLTLPLASTAQAQTKTAHFPDSNFRAALVEKYGLVEMAGDIDPQHPTNKAALNSITELSISYSYVQSVKGIEFFINLTYIDVNGNKIETIDMSKNAALIYISCDANKLTTLDVSKNKALKELSCSKNKLTSLDVSKNKKLSHLWFHVNQLTSIDVSKNKALTDLICYDNQLTSLDVSNNTALRHLTCSGNKLTSLDVSKNAVLTELRCYQNKLTALDVSQNESLQKLECGIQNHNKELMLELTENQLNKFWDKCKEAYKNQNIITTIKWNDFF